MKTKYQNHPTLTLILPDQPKMQQLIESNSHDIPNSIVSQLAERLRPKVVVGQKLRTMKTKAASKSLPQLLT